MMYRRWSTYQSVVLTVLLGLSGCLGQSADLSAARRAYAVANFSETIRLLETHLASGETGTNTSAAHLMLGSSYAEQNGVLATRLALLHFEAATSKKAELSVRLQALRRAADLLFNRGDYAAAAERLRILSELVPESERLPAILYRLGDALRRDGQWPASDRIFFHLQATYPNALKAARTRQATAWHPRGFAIVIARCATSDDALAIHDHLRLSEVYSTVSTIALNGKDIHLVHLEGIEHTWARAEERAEQIRKNGHHAEIYPQ